MTTTNLEIEKTADLELAATAIFDTTKTFRYSLTRKWHGAPDRKIAFLLLNPSTADAFIVDPTVARCMVWAQKWGFGELEVVNIFSFRATDPKVMKKAVDPVGPDNDYFIRKAAASSEVIVAGWGAHGDYMDRGKHVYGLLKSFKLTCFEVIQSGHPKHPLYVKGSIQPSAFTPSWQ